MNLKEKYQYSLETPQLSCLYPNKKPMPFQTTLRLANVSHEISHKILS